MTCRLRGVKMLELSRTSLNFELEHTTIFRGPDLSFYTYTHCMVRVDYDTIMFLGGYVQLFLVSSASSKETHLYSIKSNTWKSGPRLTGTAMRMACGAIEDDLGRFLKRIKADASLA